MAPVRVQDRRVRRRVAARGRARRRQVEAIAVAAYGSSEKSGARKRVTRILATGVQFSMHAFGVVATTGAMGVSLY